MVICYAPVTVQVVCPAVRGFTQWQNRLQERLNNIPPEILCFHHTTDSTIHSYRHWAKHPCPSNYRMRFIFKVVTQLQNIQYLNSRYVAVFKSQPYRVRNLKFPRNLIFATSKTLVNFIMKMMFCLKFGIFQFKKPKFTVHLTNLTSISLLY